MTMLRGDIEAEAERLLEKHNVLGPPVRVEAIADAEGMEIVRQRFDGDQSGFALREGTRRIIGVNSTNSKRRQRFTIAHEIGHLLLHSDTLRVDRSVQLYKRDQWSSLAVDHSEIEANAFAAAVLMPRSMMLGEIEKFLGSNVDDGLDRLAAHLSHLFDVSSEAIGYRLINLGVVRS